VGYEAGGAGRLAVAARPTTETSELAGGQAADV